MAVPMLGLTPYVKEKVHSAIATGCLPEFVRTASILAARAAQDAENKAALFVPLRKDDDSASVAIETARALRAQYGARVLLVEMQTARPSFAKRFGAQESPTLGDVVEGRRPLADAVLDAGENISVIAMCSAGKKPAVELGPLLQRIVAEYSSEFGFILIDAPAASDSSDVLALVPASPQVILVLESGVASARTAGMAADALRSAGAEILGTVLQTRRRGLHRWLRRRLGR